LKRWQQMAPFLQPDEITPISILPPVELDFRRN
jgi:hypothetical protein